MVKNIEKFVTACEENKIDTVRKMIDDGVDVNGVNSYGWTGLMKAMSNNHPAVVTLLLSHPDIDPGMTDRHDKTAEKMATNKGHHECARLVREYLNRPPPLSPTLAQNIENFVTACAGNKIDKVRKMIDDGVDVNGVSRGGKTGLMWAMFYNHPDIVTLLLAHPRIDLGMTEKEYKMTALHRGCLNNSVACVGLLLRHNKCRSDIVTMKTKISELKKGKTAEMIATEEGYHECARLVREYLAKPPALSTTSTSCPPPPDSTGPSSSQPPGKLTLAQLAQAIEDIEIEEEHIKNRKESLKAELYKRIRMNNADENPAPSAPPPSQIPECPACFDEMRPPRQIFTCRNGHLICSDCRPSIRDNMCINRCKTSYTGRATAVEQIVRGMLGIN